MGNPVQEDDEIIILSDDNDFSTGLEIDDLEKNKDDNSEEEVELELETSDENKKEPEFELELDDSSSIEDKKEENIFEDTVKEEKTEEVISDDISGEDSTLSFDLSGSDEEENIEVELEEKEKKNLDSIIDGTLLELKTRKGELSGNKTKNEDEEKFRNTEIKRLEDEIISLRTDRDTIETEIKQIDDNVVSLGKMKIPNNSEKI